MSDSSRLSLLEWRVLPLWFGLTLVAALPFSSIYRVGPLPSFFLESGSLLFVLLWVLASVFSGCLKNRPPAAAWYFAALALFWAGQARLMEVGYTGQNDMAAWSFLILALGAWAARGWIDKIGQERAVSVLAWVLLWACLVQAVIGWLQYTGLAAQFKGLLMYRNGIVEGQLGQRNHFGHYLMWGVLAAAYLWGQRRLAAWLALPLIVFLAATIGLTGSRTVFGYLLALALLLPLARCFGGRQINRSLWCMAAAGAAVLLFQFALEPLLALADGKNMTSAAERLGSSSFGQSGRHYEWLKAWKSFQAAPWFGHGWGSYSLQGFLINDVYPDGYRPYENGVLFTHSHNSLLNLLAEMGIAGTALVLGGLLWVLHGSLKRAHAAQGMFVLGAISVSLVHSLLEYPLWYIYFLSAFSLFVGFAPPARETAVSGSLKTGDATRSGLIYSGMAALLALALCGGIMRLAAAYQELRAVAGNIPADLRERSRNTMSLLQIAKTEPMLKYYAQYHLMNYIDPRDGRFPDWAYQAGRDALRYRPFANSYKWALLAYRNGDKAEAERWMEAAYRYYPARLDAYGSALSASSYYPELLAGYGKHCRAYYQSIGRPDSCITAAPPLPSAASSVSAPAR